MQFVRITPLPPLEGGYILLNCKDLPCGYFLQGTQISIPKLNLDKFTRAIKGKCMVLESSAITNKLNKFK